MKTIEERVNDFIGHPFECDEGTPITMARVAYTQGTIEQREIDIELMIDYVENMPQDLTRQDIINGIIKALEG